MTDETPAKRGEAAWKEHRELIARRNAEAHKRGQSERRSRAAIVATAEREDRAREEKQLHDLNDRIAKQRGRGTR